MKIEVGMYCYNKTNRKVGIGKIICLASNNNVIVDYKNCRELVSSGNLVASYNITDLIEVGDYVNDYKILDIVDVKDSNEKAFTIFKHKGTATIYFYSNEDIKSILTHEQFESMKYEVE